MSDEKKKLTVLLSGASFASVDNGWFELGCEALRAKGINRAIGGEAIADVANRMSRGDLYSREELDEVDVFVIMQVHNRDLVLVCSSSVTVAMFLLHCTSVADMLNTV